MDVPHKLFSQILAWGLEDDDDDEMVVRMRQVCEFSMIVRHEDVSSDFY